MKKLSVLIALVGFLGVAMTAQSASAQVFHVTPFEFVGAAGDCGPDPGSKIVGADWVQHFGLPQPGNPNNNSRNALLLSKNGPSSDCSAAGATVSNVNNKVLTELGFDVRNGGHCGAGAPRFNLVTKDPAGVQTFHFVGGCSAGTHTADTPQQGWTRVLFGDPTDGAVFFPPVAAGDKMVSLNIIFDDGTDTGPDFSGFVMLDNININGTLAGTQ